VEKLDFIDSKFRLAILAAKRAKQLVAGAKKRVDTNAENPLTIAIEEIFQGKVKFKIIEGNGQEMDEKKVAAILLGNEAEASEYENNIEEILHKDDDDSEDYRREVF
jgi:DNA-directed RNA polymerase subunit omega